MTDSKGQVVVRQPGVRKRWRGIVWVVVVWGRVVLGLVLAGAGGMAFGHAWTNDNIPMWWVGGITLLVGILLVLSGIYARTHAPAAPVEVVLPEEPAGAQEPLVPLLGAILVYRYQYISQKQLQQALAEQAQSRPRRRLGEILVLKGFLTAAQLEEALNFQHSVARQVETT
jgi:hypothetical protein